MKKQIRKGKVVIISTPFQRTDWIWGMFFGKERMDERCNSGFICAGKIIKRPFTPFEGQWGKEGSEQGEGKGSRETVVQIGTVWNKEVTMLEGGEDGKCFRRTDEGVQVLS